MSELEFEKTGQPCPCGKSSDAYAINKDGSGKCFSGQCDQGPKKDGFFPSPRNREYVEEIIEVKRDEGEVFDFFSHRGISKRTFEFYGVKSGMKDGVLTRTGFIYPNGRTKIRNWSLPKSDRGHFGWTANREGNAYLFGKDKFDPGSKDSITITEGEYDALAIYELLGNKTAAVSVRSSSTVRTDIEKEREYINSFKKIYICFDADDAGEKASKKIAGIFDFQKVYFVKLTKYKDANEYLEKGEAEDLIRTWTNAKRYSPDSIISGFNEIRQALQKNEAEAVARYPFSRLQNNLRGLHRGEMILMKGKQGIGKTEICRAIVHSTLKETESRIATIFLEEDQGTTIRGVCTYETLQPVMDLEAGFTDDDIMAMYEQAVGGRDDRLYIHSHFTSEDEGEIIDNIRFLVTVAKCDLIILDNITVLASGRPGEDERSRIDGIISRLRHLTNELKFCLVLLGHTNDDNSTRGSRFPDIVSNTVIILEREKGTQELKFFVDKARTQGAREGPAGFAKYDYMQWVLREPTPKEYAEFEAQN